MELTKETLILKLKNDQRWLERAILAIYKFQTTDEKITEIAKHENGVGFNKPDSHKMTYYSKWLLSGKHLTGYFLTDAKRRITKYWRQLLTIAEGN